MTQLPGKAPIIDYSITTAEAGNNITFKIHEFGKVLAGGNPAVTNSIGGCDEVGAEYNPLQETDAFGNLNPNQEPDIGRPPSVAIVTGASSTTAPV